MFRRFEYSYEMLICFQRDEGSPFSSVVHIVVTRSSSTYVCRIDILILPCADPQYVTASTYEHQVFSYDHAFPSRVES